MARDSVSIDRAAELLSVSRRTVYNRINEGRLETVRTLGGSQRVLMESILVLQKENLRPKVLRRKIRAWPLDRASQRVRKRILEELGR